MHQSPSPTETLESILREQEPNFLRLYLNPYVAQTCFCLDRYVRTTWADPSPRASGRAGTTEVCQSFLANGLEEALGGAIKLLRYNRRTTGTRRICVILDPADRLAGFADMELAGGERVEFLPGIRVIGRKPLDGAGGEFDFESIGHPGQAGDAAAVIDPLVLVAGADRLLIKHAEAIHRLVRRDKPAIITCVDRGTLDALRRGARGPLREIDPDVVVFDESFVAGAVPFGAFTARRSLFAAWNRTGKSTFHTTTFQPNTISTRHFMSCLADEDPGFLGRHAEELRRLAGDRSRRSDAFRRYYNPALHRLIRAAGFETTDVQAAGSFVVVNGRPIFDVVGGVACSIRGHNPPSYADEIKSPPPPGDNASPETELQDRLRELTGLGFVLPAVSGATAVENALKVALVATFPRRHVLALKAGFGGKTLLSLTGTANPSLKEHVGPLHADVHYVDPFSPDACDQVDALLEKHPFAAVVVELIQSVGGVRRIPQALVRHIDGGRARWGYLLVVDEVQTGMYRTGPFSQSRAFGLTPDLLLLGKGTSDMMFPFSLTLYSDAVAGMLARRGLGLTEAIKRRYGYELGYKTVVNVLRWAEEQALSEQVSNAGEAFDRLLRTGLAPIDNVRAVRVFGLLIAIELDARTWPRRWLGKRLAALYLLAMLRHERFPVLAGFCQHEPNTLKITPPLNVRPEEIVQACNTIVDILKRPLHRVLLAGLGRLLKPSPVGKGNHERRNDPALELAAH
jgi:acetylornithine/succinyldiaminopimelate/putrescine aminotransferase